MNLYQEAWDNDSIKIFRKRNRKNELRTIKQKLSDLVEYVQVQVQEINKMITEVSQYLSYKLDNMILIEDKQLYYRVLNETIQQLTDNIKLEILQINLKNYFQSLDQMDDSQKQKKLDEQEQQQQCYLQMSQIDQPEVLIQEVQKFEQVESFKYELYLQKKFEDDKQKKYNAFCFNKDNTILMAACGDEIKIINLNNELKIVDTLKQHSDTITSLQFMDKSNLLISGGRDQLINVWECLENKCWVLKQTLKGHENAITCLICNSDEDLIVSGSFDTKIQFWTQNLKWKDDFTLTCHLDKVLGLSLNDLGDTLISCGSEKRIYVSRASKNNTNSWNTEQIIQVQENAIRLSFIENLQFSIQQDYSKHIEIYSFYQNDKQFYQTDEIKIPKNNSFDFGFFPQKYIKAKDLLLAKNGNYVNLIKNVKNPQKSEVVSVEFNSKLIFGAFSNDGEFLVTWDADSGSIQLRKYKQNY